MTLTEVTWNTSTAEEVTITGGKVSTTYAGLGPPYCLSTTALAQALTGKDITSASDGAVGFGFSTALEDYYDVEYLIWIQGDDWYVVEDGSVKFIGTGASSATSFKLDRSSDIVTYYKDDTLEYTSTASASGLTLYQICILNQFAASTTIPEVTCYTGEGTGGTGTRLPPPPLIARF